MGTRKNIKNMIKTFLYIKVNINNNCTTFATNEIKIIVFKCICLHKLLGCEFNQSNICEDIALPPPKQFRDLESPSSSITNGTNEEEINAIDNLLYHVVDTQTNLERKPSQFDLKSATEKEGKIRYTNVIFLTKLINSYFMLVSLIILIIMPHF